MNTPHSISESAHLIEELKTHLANDQRDLHLAKPKLEALKRLVAQEEAKLNKMKEDESHEASHIAQIESDLAHTQQEFRTLEVQIQKLGLNSPKH